MKTKKRITLEPELEVIAGHLDPLDRLRLAAIYARWARQLRVSARALRPPPKPLPRLPRSRQPALN